MSSKPLQDAKRRSYQGCEEPGTCQWLCIVKFPEVEATYRTGAGSREGSRDVDARKAISKLKLCDFHGEVRELALEAERPMSCADALRLHPAAWRAFR